MQATGCFTAVQSAHDFSIWDGCFYGRVAMCCLWRFIIPNTTNLRITVSSSYFMVAAEGTHLSLLDLIVFALNTELDFALFCALESEVSVHTGRNLGHSLMMALTNAWVEVCSGHSDAVAEQLANDSSCELDRSATQTAVLHCCTAGGVLSILVLHIEMKCLSSSFFPFYWNLIRQKIYFMSTEDLGVSGIL